MSGNANRRVRMDGQAGFGLVEVLVTAVVVLLVATATVSSIGTSQKTSARTLARGITANLAERDQERMRSLRAIDLANYSATQTISQENVNYTVNSNTEFVVGADDQTVSCTSSGKQSRNLRLTTTVTPQASLRADPLTIRSLYALPIAQYSPTSGTLLVQIYKADGQTGQPGIDVNVTGPDTRTLATNDKGCAVFQFLSPGAYNIEVDEAGYVDANLRQHVTYSGTVSPGQINQATPLLYDLAGQIVVNFDGRSTTNAPGITISNSSIPDPSTRQFTAPAATGLFPFAEAYQAYSGTCAPTTDPNTNVVKASANDPTRWDPNFYSKNLGFGTGVVPAGGSVNVKVHEPVITARVRTTTDGKSFSYRNNLPVYLLQYDAGCGAAPGPLYNTVTSTVSGQSGRLQNDDYPYGNYYVCSEWVTGGKTYYGFTTAANTSFDGVGTTSSPVDVRIDTTSNNPYVSGQGTCLSLL